MLYMMAKHCWSDECEAVMGHQSGPQDQLEAFDELEIEIDLGQLEKGRPGVVVRAVSLSHQVMGSKQPLRRFCGGKACLGLSLP